MSIELTLQEISPLLAQQGFFGNAKPKLEVENKNPDLKYFDEEIYISGDKIKLSLILSGCPVMQLQQNQYAFLHKSLLEYFAARKLFEGVMADASIALGCELNERLLINEPETLKFLAERVEQDDKLKQRLFDVLDESKHDERVQVAAANAITILNGAGVSFSQKSLRHIRIKGADLSGAILDSVDLRDADLREVSLRSTWLNNAKLGGALMQEVEFGEFPYVECEDRISCIAYSPDGHYLAVGLLAGTIRLWDVVDAKWIGIFEGTSVVYSVAFNRDGSLLASGSSDQTVRLWHVASQKPAAEMKGHTDSVHSVAFSPNGSFLASGSSDHTVRLWHVTNRKSAAEMKGHRSSVLSVAFSPDGKYLASGSSDHTVRLWHATSCKQAAKMKGHRSSVLSVAFSPDGKYLASGSEGNIEDNTIRLWDVDSHQQVAVMEEHADCNFVGALLRTGVHSIAFSPDGKYLASVSGSKGMMDNTIRLWDVDSHKQVAIMKGHTSFVHSVAFSPDGRHLASGSSDETVRLWNVRSHQQVAVMKEHTISLVNSVAFSPDGKHLASANFDNMLLWNVTRRQQVAVIMGPEGYARNINSVAFSPDGKYLASSSKGILWPDEEVGLWDVDSRQEIAIMKGHKSNVNSVAFSPDGKYIASGSGGFMGGDYTVRLWDVDSRRQVAVMKGHKSNINSVVFSPEGKYIASGSADNTVRLWDVDSHQEIAKMKGHTNSVHSVAFSPDGSLLASGSSDKTVRLWDVDSHQEIAEMKGHTNSVHSVAFSPDGSLLASGSGAYSDDIYGEANNKTVHLWDIHTRKLLDILKLKSMSNISALVFKKIDEKIFFCVSGGKTIYIFEMKSVQSKFVFILLWSLGDESGLRSENLDLGGVVGLENQHNRLLKQRQAVGNLSQRETETVLQERIMPVPYNPKRPPYNLFGQQHLITPNSAMVNLVRKTKGENASKHVFLVIEQIEHGFYILTRADLYLDKKQKYSQGLIVTEGQALVEISVKPLRDMQLLAKPDVDVAVEDMEKHEHCVYKSWPISQQRAHNLINNLEADRVKRLSYCNLGNSQLYQPSDIKEEKYNCLTWCEAHLSRIGVDVSKQQSLLDSIVAYPQCHLPDSLDKDNEESNFGEICLMM